MTKDQAKNVEEKEEKRKIRVIAQIDEFLGVQGQAYIKGKLKEVLSVAHQIIDIAKSENLKSFIRDQKDLIAKIEKLLKEREEQERERISAEKERLRLERIKNLKIELNQLEHKFNAGLIAEDFLKTEEAIKNAKNLLLNLDDTKLSSKWENFEKKHIRAKTKEALIEKAQNLIKESINLKKKFLFDDLKLKLLDMMNQLKDNGISEYLKELEDIQTNIIKAEQNYLNVVQTIDKLVQEIETLQVEKEYENAIAKCENLLKLAESIKKNDLIETYLKVLIKLQKDLSFQELKETVNKLNEEGLSLLKKGKILLSLEKFKMIKGSINHFLEGS
ncbi:MAG: hypothetical protein ACFFBV_07540 [Promethearchaeota archaeon]